MSTTTLERSDEAADLTDSARGSLWSMWGRRSRSASHLRRMRDYAEGRGGIPDLTAGVSRELRELAKLAPVNLCGVVVGAFDRGLSVVGFRSPTESDDEPAWTLWQANRMDARQSEVHRSTLIYGEAYVSVLPNDDRSDGLPEFVTWSPLDVVAEYDDPRRDLFPSSAMLLRRAEVDGVEGWSVLLIDSTHVQPGRLLDAPKGARGRVDGLDRASVVLTGEPWEHGATYHGQPVCPVVRFINERVSEDRPPRGEVEPIIQLNRAANAVNFDRLVVARFGAFQQKVIIGWTGTADEQVKMSAARMISFEDHPDDVKVQSFPASMLTPYNELLREIKEQVALEAAIPVYAATGSLANVSTETAALVESAHQRKLQGKRLNLGESWEQVLRLGIAMAGLPEPSEAAEMIWRETEARAFGAVVDGMVKLATIPAGSEGVPIEELLDLIPGMTQQRIKAIRDALRRRRSSSLVAALSAPAHPVTDAITA